MRRLVLGYVAFLTLSSLYAETDQSRVVREIRDLRRGEIATIRGQVVRYPDYDELVLQDRSGRIEVYLGERSASEPVARVGETILVHGRADDDGLFRPREIYAFEITREDGSTTRLEN